MLKLFKYRINLLKIGRFEPSLNIKNFALINYVSVTDTKTGNQLPTLVGVLTSEDHPISYAVGG